MRTGDQIQKRGVEFGATTGRKRRCGWLDTVIVRNAVRLNSLSGLAITKLDVLGGQEHIKVCNAYTHNGRVLDEFPTSLEILTECEPVYETLPGWPEDIRGVRRFEDLPVNARNYLSRIEALTDVSIDIVSVGPGRDETFIVKNPFTC
ncbi:MAG: adenylosuccinate synthetase [Desulfobacterales bacterium]|nr:adenylosuccinate synthetase [Desulfobacterales bacterium]